MKNIFERNIDIDKTAYLNWRITPNEDIVNMIAMAEGFISSSLELATRCLEDNHDKKADMLIFPILTNANHGIELYLKSIIWTLNKLMLSNSRIEGSHNLQQLLQVVQSKLKSRKDKDLIKHFNKENDDLIKYIEELFSKIKTDGKKDNMDFSRYPLNNKYDKHFYVGCITNVEIDLENFILRFKRIKESLDNAASYFYDIELMHGN